MTLTEPQQQLIEQIGVALECKGERPAAARIIGLLLVADRPALSFEEISDALQMSKSAISNALTFLQQARQLEYITHSGDRKRYFRLRVQDWQESLLRQVQEITSFSQLLHQVLVVRPATTPAYNQQLLEISSFMEYVSSHLPQLLLEWKKKKFFCLLSSFN
ncbi:GbsR/MarR family transcriptional regulator [Cesiribacter andamanensis]|uniref:Uncharacterized protein n=1 Tax=Cesiribacter andamanensis AMV16 TaxID=1279009 RepID=M7N4U8_9BACT|nr:ArsR family transcriptional regulator [Cesiribacter andamanensis]EMR02312.1 hypothetical protein ADICEAN_02549 [Cesiribacter andamanensis AMV16]